MQGYKNWESNNHKKSPEKHPRNSGLKKPGQQKRNQNLSHWSMLLHFSPGDITGAF
jgi:hypothetical protein